MDLDNFMATNDISDHDLAIAIDRDRSTISRIRRKEVEPSGRTLLAISGWCDGFAKRHRILRRDRLDWDYLRDEAG